MENGLEGNETGCGWMRMVVNYPNFLETPKAGETEGGSHEDVEVAEKLPSINVQYGKRRKEE